MSLKIWLPLLGNIENKGTHNATVTLSGATVDTAGKIGSCYSFDGTDDYIQLTNFAPNGWAEFSLSAWIYPTADFNGFFLIRGGSMHRITISSNGFVFRDTNNSTQRYTQFSPTISTNIWTHIACVYKRGEIWLYQNGILSAHNSTYYNASSTLLSDMDEIRIARVQSSSGNVYFTGKINDFRIYDHALSTTEVHELAQGMVRHYKMDDAPYIDNTNYLSNATTFSQTNTYKKISFTQVEIDAISGKEVTISIDVKSAATGTSCDCYFRSSSGSIGKLYKMENISSEYQTYTFTTIAPESGFVTFAIRNNSGAGSDTSVAYFYTNISIKKTYSVLNNNTTKLFDSSGYGKHGTIVGTTTIDSISPRYLSATHMDTTSTTNHTEASALPSATQTVSFWLKCAKVQHCAFVDSACGMSFGYVSGNSAFYVTCTSGSAANSMYGFTIPSFSTTDWNHIVVQKIDKSTFKVYLNGVEQTARNSTNNSWTSQANDLWLFNRKYSSYATTAGADLRMSDFRAYVTLLSIDDIKELYRVGLKIDKRSGMHTYELHEAQDQLYPANQGILQCEHLEEDEKASFFKDKHIETNNLIEM